MKVIKADLADSGIPSDQLEDVVGDIAFSVASLVDGSGFIMADKEDAMLPLLTFAEDLSCRKLITTLGGSSMHENVFSAVESVFNEDTG